MLDNEILGLLVKPYGVEASQLEFLRANQNFVYACTVNGERRIIRISTQRHRSRSEIEAELQWISLLVSQGIRACCPIPTADGRGSVELQHEGQVYVVACFEHAPGAPVAKPADDAIYTELGKVVGGMHRASRAANESNLLFDRPAWQDSRLLKQDFTAVREALAPEFERAVVSLIQSAGETKPTVDNYGLIHGDAHFGNCFQHQGALWIFDFDNCEYGYFLQDLAVVLYDAIYCRELRGFADPGLDSRVAQRWRAFMQGYSQTGVLQTVMPQDLKTFFLLREAVIYVHYLRTLDVATLGESFKQGLEIMRSNVAHLQHQLDFTALEWTSTAAK